MTSSWEQARHRPWSMLSPQAKRLEASADKLITSTPPSAIVSDGNPQNSAPMTASQVQQKLEPKPEFEWVELFRQMAFGGTVGAFTGSVFGFMDGMREAQDSKLLKNASNAAKGKFLLQGSSRAGLVFGTFFSGFHAIKYGTRIGLDPGMVAEIALASVVSMGGLAYQTATRPFLPYGAMLICMDCVSTYMRENP